MQETGVVSLTSDPQWVWCQNFKNSKSLCPLISQVAQMVENLPAMRRPGFDLWVGKIPWRRAWQPTPVFLPGESCGQKSLAGYRPWAHKESNVTEWLSLHFTSSPMEWVWPFWLSQMTPGWVLPTSVPVTPLWISVISCKTSAIYTVVHQTWFNGIAWICAELSYSLISASLCLLEILPNCLTWSLRHSWLIAVCLGNFRVCSPRWLLSIMAGNCATFNFQDTAVL